ncbi:MAG: hypothetical protein EAZ79_23495 [Oscillatoriales cyanobacterium]|nr:MAG: hypothetical protein EAZ79_23495 [Oscillatoriales cyanobacterium]
MTTLTVEILCSEAAIFSAAESQHPEPLLYGITDGKAVGTYLEQKFRLYLKQQYEFIDGNSASLDNEGNKDDLLAFMFDKNLPVDEIEAGNIADEILRNPPLQGFLTISNALQWRLQYGRVIERAGQ